MALPLICILQVLRWTLRIKCVSALSPHSLDSLGQQNWESTDLALQVSEVNFKLS